MTRRSSPASSRGAPSRGGRADALLHENAGLCICGNLRMAARLVTSMYDAALRPCGIEANQMIMLWVCHEAGEIPGYDLARIAGMDPSTASRNVAVLEARGLVECRPSREDRRERFVRLTPRGRATLRRALPHWKKAQDALAARTAGLGDMVAVGRLLRKATRMLQSDDGPRGTRGAAGTAA